MQRVTSFSVCSLEVMTNYFTTGFRYFNRQYRFNTKETEIRMKDKTFDCTTPMIWSTVTSISIIKQGFEFMVGVKEAIGLEARLETVS